MIRLSSKGLPAGVDSPIVGVVRWMQDENLLGVFQSRAEAFLQGALPAALVCRAGVPVHDLGSLAGLPRVTVPEAIQPLLTGDVVALHESGRVDTMFRSDSLHNSLFVTEQCNSYCLMCSQPPRRVDDLAHFLALNSRALRLMPPDVALLGITGGEPTLLEERLADLLRLCRKTVPSAQVDVLSNGRKLADETLATAIAASADDKVLFTIPLYADNPLRHDYIVQAEGAFNETLLGFYNLAALGVRTEVRVVLHRESVLRLPNLARFVQKNLPFVEQVAFMGLEMTGLARAHEELLWVEPPEYMQSLHEAVDHLVSLGMRASIYNLPRCLVPPVLWPYLRQSISDWKREYVPACEGCRERRECGGAVRHLHSLEHTVASAVSTSVVSTTVVTADSERRRPSTSLALVAVLCANPIALVVLGASPWLAVGICLAVVLAVQLCWRRFGTRLATVYVVNFVALGGIWLHAELLVRTRFHDYVMEDLYAQHGTYYFNRPRLVTRLTDKEYAADYLTNREGYRIGYSQDMERSVNEVDWLFLGDSYTQGAQVPFESLYTTLLYRRYPDRIVLNAGVSGWGLYESLAFLEDRGAALRPKVVFVQVANFNDFMKVGPRRAGLSDYLMQESEVVRLLLQNIKYVNPTNLPLGRWVEPFYATDEENRLYNVFYVPSSKEKARDLAEVSSVVRKLADAATRLGARLVLVQLPTKEQVSFQYLEEAVRGLAIDPRNLDLDLPNRLLRGIADSLGIALVDPLETWRVAEAFPYFHYDEHLSAAGHQMLTDAIDVFLQKEGIASSVTMASTSYAGDRYPQFVGTDTLVFHSPRDGNSELLQADIATWTEQRLTTDDVPETHPVVLPTREGLVFAAGDADAGTTRLWRSDRNGRGAVRLEPRDTGFAAIPAAFPDGTRLVFPSWGPRPDAARVSLTTLNLRTGERETLPQPVGQAWRPAVHPSGRYVAYIGRVGSQHDLFELDLQSRTTRQLTNTPHDEWDPAYTPDGASLIYAARLDANWDLMRLSRSGDSPVRLTETRGDEWDPQVSPDGRRIAYGGEYGLMRGIYLMDFRQ